MEDKIIAEEVEESAKSEALTEAILKELAIINGKINKSSTNELITKLKHYNLDTSGDDGVRRKRLKNHYRRIKFASSDSYLSEKLAPFYVVVDFEATCEESNPTDYVHEIIEFPAVLIDTSKQAVISTFQRYCKPSLRPQLSEFCTELTGITQEQVDCGESFPQVLAAFEDWLNSYGLLKSKRRFIIVTDGPWDMARFLHAQCKLSEIPYPGWATMWLNLRKAFSNFYKCQRFCLKMMLDHAGMEFEGRPHCGLDDAVNIARILVRMMCDGAHLQTNERISSVLPGGQPSATNRVNATQGHTSPKTTAVTDQMRNLRLEANTRPVNHGERKCYTTYEMVRRQRGIKEQKIGQDISREDGVASPEAAEETQRKVVKKLKRRKQK